MLIPITNIVLNADGTWTFTWANVGAAFYRVVLWGIQIARLNGTTYTWTGREYSTYPPPLEIAFQDQKVISETYLPYLIIQWYGDPSAQGYLVQQKSGNNWTTISTPQEVGSWVYTYQTVILKDENTYVYRVIALDQYGNQSTPRQYIRYVVCPPALAETSFKVQYNNPNVQIVAQ